MKIGYQLRKLFCLILTDCNPTQPDVLWEKHALQICDDLPHRLRMSFSIPNPTDGEVCDYGLFLLNEYLVGLGKSLTDYPQMPLPTRDWQQSGNNRLILEHEALAYEGLDVVADQKISQLNVEQLHADTEVTDSVLNNSGKIFFLNGLAGTGKIFVYNTIADSMRSKGHIVIMVASSGIASLLLTGGRTAHSTFKITLNVLDDFVCDIGKKSFKAELFKRGKLIVWDEVPMQHRYCVEAVDRSLQDLLGIKKPFGGITVVLGGDFKQTLPIIPKGTREQIVCASLIKSQLWQEVEVLTLVQNMRLTSDDEGNIKFADYLIEIGTNPEEIIELPLEITRCKNSEELLFKVYPKLNVERTATPDYLRDQTILSAHNDDVSDFNALAIHHFPGEMHEFFGADQAIEDDIRMEDRGNRIANENMQAPDPPSLPPFKDGLCNGTRLMMEQLGVRVIEVRILTGSHVNDRVFIPRITLQPTDSEIPFKMSSRQFPVRLAFAMTINKSQGQSVKIVGIDLQNPVFSHGQLYVALSRCTSLRNISVLLSSEENETTTNVVYPEILL
ncbi:hypothetical protein AQUCO_00800042v1 [Aquilegia coerulea]|uniref:ATP-dependent DNA helicase n=1 Tax=Aquilegia coerulea TaxID=218851 RepID=A0A2G5EH39_AQUCA|nr:hypothetical protein AQUCO_00800042v1 [Aquilegia coerulea]